MLRVTRSGDGVWFLSGRFDASQVEAAEKALREMDGPATIDLSGLEYISSAGISALLRAYKRLKDAGHGLRAVNLSPHIRNVFRYAGLEKVFEIE